jgi:hypothetical protein
MSPRRRLYTLSAAVSVALLAAFPAAASAHGLVGKQDLPIPRWLFAWAAAAVLVVSFVALATMWPKPVMQTEEAGRRILRVPPWAEPVCGAIGVAIFVVCVYAGLAGTQTPTANLTPTMVYVIFWVGIPVASLLFGDVFRPFNPWRAVARAASWVAGKVVRGADAPEPLPYPHWLGRWPAVAGILGFAWLELVYSNKADPSTLAVLSLGYAAIQLVAMSLYGIEPWERYGDAFGVYFNLFSRLSPARWRNGVLDLRRPVAGAALLDMVPGTAALLCTMIGTTSFDGFSQGPAWSSLAPHLQKFFSHFGFNAENALEAGFTLGLICVVLIISSFFWLGVAGMRTIEHEYSVGDLGAKFAHSLVPIALAYVIAHYFSLLAYQGQALAYLVSDPLGHGADIFGTATATIDYNVISANGVWYVQVGALVTGHVAGLVLAHDRALALFRDAREATRSQYWMLAVMVGFTSLGLWLLSASL